MFEIIKIIIDEWDPIGLLAIHSPLDEYDIETKEIANYLKENYQLEELSTKIFNIFTESFGDDIFNKTMGECRIIADKIVNAIK